MAPAFTSAGQLVRPLDYRSWVFVTSGLGMTYGPAQPAAGRPPLFDNVFVTRDAYAAFLRSGTWPDKTMFILEGRRAETNVSINNGGHTQGEMAFMEAAVKDTGPFQEHRWLGILQLRQSRRTGGERGSAAGDRHVLRLPLGEHGRRQHLRAVLSGAFRRRESEGDDEAYLRSEQEAVRSR